MRIKSLWPILGPAGSLESGLPIVALHCSGAHGGQWRKLVQHAGAMHVIAPSLFGTPETGAWHGDRAFTLRDEAEAIIDLVDTAAARVHLVGHSYGGAVALKVATVRPERIASLTLYEPSAFHILKELGSAAASELAEIEDVAATVAHGMLTGTYSRAAACFVDYWGGHGSWAAMRADRRDAMLRWLPKGPLEFNALLDEETRLAQYGAFEFPILVMCGEHARMPSRLIAEALARQCRTGTLQVIAEAGHMGPVTHAEAICSRIIAHVRDGESWRATADPGDARRALAGPADAPPAVTQPGTVPAY